MKRARPAKASNPNIAELIRRYRAGETLSQLAKAAGVSSSTIHKRLHRAGVTCRPAGGGPGSSCFVPIPGLQQILTRYANGESSTALAKEFGISNNRIYTALRKAGVPIRRAGRPIGTVSELKLSFAQREQLLADLRAVKHPTLKVFAKKYGVSREMVRKYAQKAGIIYFLREERKARTSWNVAQRKIARQAAARKRKKLKAAADAAIVDALAALCRARASDEEIFLKTGIRRAGTKISALRKRYPSRFPYRNPNASKDAIAKKRSCPSREGRRPRSEKGSLSEKDRTT